MKRVIFIVRWTPAFLITLAFCAAPSRLWAVPLRWYSLKSDDFFYIGWSRSATALADHLATPFHGHVVPLYLIETHLLARLAGSLEALPAVLGRASCARLVLAMLAAGHLVARETGRPGRGLAAMAAAGLTSVLGPALLWYAAGQAIEAGTMMLAMLAALQAWRARGSRWWLALAILAAIAAPLIWSAGYIAGLVGMAYLRADGRRACRRAAMILPMISAALALLVWCAAGRGFAPSSQLAGRPLLDPARAGAAATQTAQAICEAMVLNNLGIDAASSTTAGQAMVLVTMLVACWAWSRRRSNPAGSGWWPRPNPLEAAGAMLVVGNFGIIFAARGVDSHFEGLRTLGWYNAIAELGAILFAAGWWSGPIDSPPPRSIEPPRRPELLAVVLFAAVVLVLQLPRVDRVIYRYDGAGAPLGPNAPIVVPPVTPEVLAARARTQRRALAALDRIERAARVRGTGRVGVRQAVSEVSIPEMPQPSLEFDAQTLLDLPGSPTDPE